MSAVLDTNAMIARGYRDLVQMRPERAVAVDRGFLRYVQSALAEISETGAGHAMQGRCSCLSEVLAQLLKDAA